MSVRRTMTAITLASMLSVQLAPALAHAENAMGYRLLTMAEATRLPDNQGALGLEVASARRISDSGLTFNLMEVRRVKAGSAGAAAGLQTGDQIISVNGRVFPTVTAFAAYLKSVRPGARVSVDYIPAGRGPSNAQRVAVVMGKPGTNGAHGQAQERSGGMSTRTKIGLGAAAILGCYYMGCFSGSGSSAQ
jgi:predicted metalloprotease with PDZ domain